MRTIRTPMHDFEITDTVSEQILIKLRYTGYWQNIFVYDGIYFTVILYLNQFIEVSSICIKFLSRYKSQASAFLSKILCFCCKPLRKQS